MSTLPADDQPPQKPPVYATMVRDIVMIGLFCGIILALGLLFNNLLANLP
ncbi:MAG TPA: hypothetical protein VIJ23_17595 [Mycobacterium sp.]